MRFSTQKPPEKPKKKDCQIEFLKRGDKEIVKFRGDCSREQIDVARQRRLDLTKDDTG